LLKARREQKRKSIALDNNLVTSSLPKKLKTPCIIKALVPKASRSGLRSNTKSGLDISLVKDNKGA
jgi:hypothetical protein